MKILVDALGGDNAPAAVYEGAAEALKKREDLLLVLAGPKEGSKQAMEKFGADLSRIEFLDAQTAVLNTDHPLIKQSIKDAKPEVVSQLIDLALLQNGLLKGEALNNFVKRSIDLI